MGWLAGGEVGFLGIVVNAEVVEVREEFDEIFAVAVPAFADLGFRDVVAPFGDALFDAGEVEFGGLEAAEPKVELVAGGGGFDEQLENVVAAESGLEAVVDLAGDGILQKVAAHGPGMAIGEREGEVGMEAEKLLCDGVGVKDLRTLVVEGVLADAGFAGTIDSGENIEVRLGCHDLFRAFCLL
jgi:hypothetical protein